MSTPGIRRALHALAAAKHRNATRIKAGKPAIIAGKKISVGTYKRRYGAPK